MTDVYLAVLTFASPVVLTAKQLTTTIIILAENISSVTIQTKNSHNSRYTGNNWKAVSVARSSEIMNKSEVQFNKNQQLRTEKYNGEPPQRKKRSERHFLTGFLLFQCELNPADDAA